MTKNPDQCGDKQQLPTPLTDDMETYYSEIITGRDHGLYWVKADFARRLERELASLNVLYMGALGRSEAKNDEIAQLRHDLERATANHAADLSAPSAAEPSKVARLLGIMECDDLDEAIAQAEFDVKESLAAAAVIKKATGMADNEWPSAHDRRLYLALEQHFCATFARSSAAPITEPMVEAAAQRMVALVMSRIIEKPQLVQWQQWAGSARAILEAALEAHAPRSATQERWTLMPEGYTPSEHGHRIEGVLPFTTSIRDINGRWWTYEVPALPPISMDDDARGAAAPGGAK